MKNAIKSQCNTTEHTAIQYVHLLFTPGRHNSLYPLHLLCNQEFLCDRSCPETMLRVNILSVQRNMMSLWTVLVEDLIEDLLCIHQYHSCLPLHQYPETHQVHNQWLQGIRMVYIHTYIQTNIYIYINRMCTQP